MSKTAPFRLEKDRQTPHSHSLNVSRQAGPYGNTTGGNIRYRHQIDPVMLPLPTDHPSFNPAVNKDMLSVWLTENPDRFPCNGQYELVAYPGIKPGDVLGYQNGSGFVVVKTFTEADFDQSNFATYHFDPTALTPDNASGLTAGTRLTLLRGESLNRVSAVVFPKSNKNGTDQSDQVGFTQKIMVVQYEDDSINHQEIKKVTYYDRLLQNGTVSWYPLQETEYTYQRLHTVGAYKHPQRRFFDYTDAFDFNNSTSQSWGSADLDKIRSQFFTSKTNHPLIRWQTAGGDLCFIGLMEPEGTETNQGANYGSETIILNHRAIIADDLQNPADPCADPTVTELGPGHRIQFIRRITGKTGQTIEQKDMYTIRGLSTMDGESGQVEVHLVEPPRRAVDPTEEIRVFQGETLNQERVQIGSEANYYEQELDTLRKKTTRYLNHPGNPVDNLAETAAQFAAQKEAGSLPALDLENPRVAEQTTLFGGAFDFTLITAPDPGVFRHQGYSGFSQADENTGIMQWTLSGKPFRYTYQINPDGSGQVFDLDPAGLDLNPFHSVSQTGSRPFKTYTFDTGFKTAMIALAGDYVTGEKHYLEMMPEYNVPSVNPPTVAEFAQSPDQYLPSGIHIPNLSELFTPSFKALSKCWQAEIAALQVVPKLGFSFNTKYVSNENLRVILGQPFPPSDQNPAKSRHFRISAFTALWNGPDKVYIDKTYAPNYWQHEGVPFKDLLESQRRARILEFFHGNLSTEVDVSDWDNIQDPDADYLWTTTWERFHPNPLLDNGSLGDYSAPYSQFNKIFRLEPLFSYQARNLEGFDWDTTKGHINMENRWFVKGTRYGNGGFLYEGAFGNDASQAGLSTFSFPDTSAGAVAAKPGDVILVKNLFYTLEDVEAGDYFKTHNSIVTPDNTSYRIYRFHNPTYLGDHYKGLDSFGNMAYQEVFFGGDSVVFSTDQQSGLLPDFTHPGTKASSVSVNDADKPENNDLINWNFFGRVTKQYYATERGFFLDDSTTADPVAPTALSWIEDGDQAMAHRFYTLYDYRDPNYPWTMTRSLVLAKPFHSALNDFAVMDPVIDMNSHGLGVSWAHYHDSLSESYYYQNEDIGLNPNANAMSVGQIKTQKVGKIGFPGDYTRTSYIYDNFGFGWDTASAVFKNGVSPFATGSRTYRDANTGLVRHEISFVGNPLEVNFTGMASIVSDPTTRPRWDDYFMQLASRRSKSTTYYEYDNLHRVVKTYTKDTNGNLWGPTSFTTVKDALWTVTQSVQKRENESGNAVDEVVMTTTTFTNGLGMEVLT